MLLELATPTRQLVSEQVDEVVLVAPQPRRPFQGWRYFEHKDVPQDLGRHGEAVAVPQELAAKLRELGVW